jgi:MoxR-like ATPase
MSVAAYDIRMVTQLVERESAFLDRLFSEVSKVIVGQREMIERVFMGLLCGGHVLLEGAPGLAKTLTVNTLARCLELEFKRVQFTPDLLPSDIVGVSVFNPRSQAFAFHEGPVFTHLLLADEINRASPRTQSALLEAMAEYQVSIDGERRALPRMFFVIATQNPVEFHGTYPLPEAQMDRFALKLGLGYVGPEQEVAMLSAQNAGHPLDTLEAVATVGDVLAARAALADIRVADALKRYVVDLVAATRSAPGVALGASPRASLALIRLAQALAAFDGEAFVSPEHVQEIAVDAIAHRLVLDRELRFAGGSAESVVTDILRTLPVPV